MTFAVVKVEPIGTRTGPAFVTRRGGKCSYEDVTSPVYPESPNGDRLRVARRTCNLSLREAAAALQLTAEQVSGLEFGRYTFAAEDDWWRALEVYGAVARPDGE